MESSEAQNKASSPRDCDDEKEEEEKEEEVTPRRSSRKRPSRHSSTVEKGLRKFKASKSGRRKLNTSSSDSGEDGEDNKSSSSDESDEDKSPEVQKDEFLQFCKRAVKNDKPSEISHNSQSHEAGPSSAGNAENEDVSDEQVTVDASLNTPESCTDQNENGVQSGKGGADKTNGDEGQDDTVSEHDSIEDEVDLDRILRFV